MSETKKAIRCGDAVVVTTDDGRAVPGTLTSKTVVGRRGWWHIVTSTGQPIDQHMSKVVLVRSAPRRRAAAAAAPVAPPAAATASAPPARTWAIGDEAVTHHGHRGRIVWIGDRHAELKCGRIRVSEALDELLPPPPVLSEDDQAGIRWWNGRTPGARAALCELSGSACPADCWAWYRRTPDADVQVLEALGRKIAGTKAAPTPAPARTSDLIAHPLRFPRPAGIVHEITATEEMIEIRTRFTAGENLNVQIKEIRRCWLAALQGTRCALHLGTDGWVWLYASEADELLEQLGARGLQDRRVEVLS